MKKFVKPLKSSGTYAIVGNRQEILAASDFGTQYYKCSRKDIQEALDENSDIFTAEAFRYNGFDAIKMKSLYGSRVIGDYLYLCTTDGDDLIIDGEPVDPEEALEIYESDLQKLRSYIKDADSKVINRQISSYEMNIDVDKVAKLLMDKGYSFYSLVRTAIAEDLISI